MASIFQDGILADNVHAVLQTSLSLKDEERFGFLTDQVIPDGGNRLRLAGKFVASEWVPGGGTQDTRGGILLSPLFELLDLAKNTDRLNELKAKATAVVPSGEHQLRSKSALLFLIALEIADEVESGKQFNLLFDLVRASAPKSAYDQWPETLVAYRVVQRFPKWEAIADLLEYLRAQRVARNVPAHSEGLQTHLWSLTALSRLQQKKSSQLLSSKKMKQWSPVVRHRAETRGQAFPQASWSWGNEGGRHVAGHENDSLYFSSPLTGDFDVEADVSPSGTTQVLSAGMLIGHTWDGKGILEGSVRMGVARQPLDPPFAKMERWTHYRATYRGDQCRVYLNGRLVKSIDRTQTTDPWVALRSWSQSDATFRDVRITGNPVIPERITLMSPDLAGWSDYYDKPFFNAAVWDYVPDSEGNGQIHGHHHAQLQGTSAERLLRYVRPLDQTGVIEYEFLYSQPFEHAHPAIDRCAFVLHSDGVRIHELTDGAYDQTLRAPNNMSRPMKVYTDQLPLKLDSWNRVKLIVNGNDVTLELNGQRICDHQLNAHNNRLFGVFHYADRQMAIVRNVLMSGDWPRVLPSLEQQPFAESEAAKLNQTLPAEAFHHDFAMSGLPERDFAVQGKSTNGISATSDGVLHVVHSSGKWTQSSLAPTFRMDGDFDVSAKFNPLTVTGQEFNGCALAVTTTDGHSCDVGRRRQGTDNDRVSVRWGEPTADGKVRNSYDNISTEATSGTLRIARRGDRMVVLFAENDSDQFRVIGSRAIPNSTQYSADAKLIGIANLGGTTQILWKSVQLNAEQLWYLPNPNEVPQRLLFTMKADGSEVRQVTQEISAIDNQGSPEWSPDGQQIAFDGWTGRAATSHIFLVNVDGTNLRDIGIGAMPTFSPDGKRLALTWSPHGMATMNTEGVDRKVLTPDGWGAQWSPNGKWVAYQSRERVNGQSQVNITIIDVKTREKQTLLKSDDAAKYRQIYWNMEWSPDSRKICFEGSVSEGTEVGLASVDGSPVRVLTTANVYEDFAWHPDGSTIVMSGPLLQFGGADPKATYSTKGYRLYQFDLKSEQMTLLPHQPMDRDNNSASWSPDGKQLAFVSQALPGPVRWMTKKSPTAGAEKE